MSKSSVYIGVDVAKAELVLDRFDRGSTTVPNTTKAIESLAKRILKLSGEVVVVCEASGGYERLLLATLMAKAIPVALVNPKRVRDYARSRGILAKTDKIDASVLSAFGTDSNPRTLKPASPRLDSIRALLIRRWEITAMITQEKARLDPEPPKQVARLIRSHIKNLQQQQVKILESIETIVADDQQLGEKRKRLQQIQSIGPLTSLSLLVFLPELGHLSDNQAAALSGLAPYNDDSGTHRGKRITRGGRTRLRNALYMSAVCASKSNPVLSPFYHRLISKGKPPKLALTAVMRKLVVLANRCLADPTFQPVNSH